MNFTVSSQVPEDHYDYTEIEPNLTYDELLAKMTGLLNAGYLKITSGPLESKMAITLVDELDHDEYEAIVGPVIVNLDKLGAGHLQVYFSRKKVV